MPKLTKSIVEAIPLPDQRPTLVWDDRIAGFGIKVLASGARKYIFKYRTLGGRGAQQRWLSIGTHGAITVDQARSIALKTAAQIAAGGDPQRERMAVASHPTLTQLWDRFEKSDLLVTKPTTQRDYRYLWTRLIKPKLGSIKVRDIKRADAERLHKGLAARPYQANRMLGLLSRLLNLPDAVEWREEVANPCKEVRKFKEEPRQRFLDDAEITAVQDAIAELSSTGHISRDAGNALLLLLLTGARSTEIKTAEWAWVDWQRKLIALPKSKTGARTIYLNDMALEVLQRQREQSAASDYVFPGRDPAKPLHNLRKPWSRVCDAAGLVGVRVHDLRHTAASIAIGAGASLAVIGRLLGHTQAQTTLRYAHLAADPALRAANLIGEAVRGSRASAEQKSS